MSLEKDIKAGSKMRRLSYGPLDSQGILVWPESMVGQSGLLIPHKEADGSWQMRYASSQVRREIPAQVKFWIPGVASSLAAEVDDQHPYPKAQV